MDTVEAIDARPRHGGSVAGGLAILGVLVGGFVLVFAASYPLTAWAERDAVPLVRTDPAGILYSVLALVGGALAIRERGLLRRADVATAAAFGILVWIAIQSRYWYNGWEPIVPFGDPTLHAVQTLAMTLGGLAVTRVHPSVACHLATGRIMRAAWSAGAGILLGLPFAVVNVALLVVLQGATPDPAAPAYGALRALEPAILEEVAFRLLLLAGTLTVLDGCFERRTAAALAIALVVAFHSATHVQALLVTNPLGALVTVAILGLVFGLPMALLAYRRGIEAAIGFHWAIDAVRFGLGL